MAGKNIVIDEPTVGSIGNWSVGVANIWERDSFECSCGETKSGLSANISIWRDETDEGGERSVYVRVGCRLRLKGSGKWKVVRVVESPPSKPDEDGGPGGFIELEQFRF